MKSVYSAVRTGALNRAVCAWAFRTNSDLCHLQHKLTGFYSRDEKCLQRGTDWVFKYSGLRFVCKGLIQLATTFTCMLHLNAVRTVPHVHIAIYLPTLTLCTACAKSHVCYHSDAFRWQLTSSAGSPA